MTDKHYYADYIPSPRWRKEKIDGRTWTVVPNIEGAVLLVSLGLINDSVP